MPAKSLRCLTKGCPLAGEIFGEEAQMGLSMAERKAVTKELTLKYRSGPKKAKGQILDHLCAVTGWNRDHARRALRLTAARASDGETVRRGRRRRQPIYGDDVLEPLRKVWATLDGPCGKRLAPFMEEIVAAMERVGELELTSQQRDRLVAMSAATIDRRLAGDRSRLPFRSRGGTKPGSMLKSQIPIRTFADWNDARPGFVECDLVAHDGGRNDGHFCQTLDVTDVASGWTELRAVTKKSHRLVFDALVAIRDRLPFPLLGLDSDNGAEFINHELTTYCAEREITFTRSRPYRKNDACFVEQKNWTVVRHAVGYLRYDTAQTPYQRLLESDIPAATKQQLTDRYHQLNPVELKRKIIRHQDELMKLARYKGIRERSRKGVKPISSRAS